jgi:hypothetical protein
MRESVEVALKALDVASHLIYFSGRSASSRSPEELEEERKLIAVRLERLNSSYARGEQFTARRNGTTYVPSEPAPVSLSEARQFVAVVVEEGKRVGKPCADLSEAEQCLRNFEEQGKDCLGIELPEGLWLPWPFAEAPDWQDATNAVTGDVDLSSFSFEPKANGSRVRV